MGSDVTRGYRNQSPGKQIHQLFCFLKWQILFFFLLTILCIVFFRTILTSSKSCFLLILNGGLLQNKGNTIPFNLTEGCPLRALQLSHYRFKETRYIRILAQRWQNKVKMVRKKKRSFPVSYQKTHYRMFCSLSIKSRNRQRAVSNTMDCIHSKFKFERTLAQLAKLLFLTSALLLTLRNTDNVIDYGQSQHSN